MDILLSDCVNSKSSQQKKKQEAVNDEANEFMKRDVLVKKVLQKMQDWYEIGREEGGVVQKYVDARVFAWIHWDMTRNWQERNAETDSGGYQSPTREKSVYGHHGLRAFPCYRCRSDGRRIAKNLCECDVVDRFVHTARVFERILSLAVSPVAGKQEVMVQGKQAKAAVEYLTSNGVPKQWIECTDQAGMR